MENLELILTIAIPIYSLIVILAGVYLGHWLTLKAFAHVQPSMKEMAKSQGGSVSTEKDWFEEAMKDTPEELSKSEEEKIKAEFKKTGLPESLLDSYKKRGKSPADFYGYDTEYPQGGVEEELEKADSESYKHDYGLKEPV